MELCNFYLSLVLIKLVCLLRLCSCHSQRREHPAPLMTHLPLETSRSCWSLRPPATALPCPRLPLVVSSHTLPGTESRASQGVSRFPELPMSQAGAPWPNPSCTRAPFGPYSRCIAGETFDIIGKSTFVGLATPPTWHSRAGAGWPLPPLALQAYVL